MSRHLRPIGPFVGVAWGVPSVRGAQVAHIVTGTSLQSKALRALCGRAHGATYPYTSHGRPMVTCRACRRIAAAHLAELPTGETPAERRP